MADELVFSGGEIVYTMPQLPKVASVPLNGSAVLVGFKDAPDGEEVLFDFDPRAEKATKLDYELAAVSGLLTGALNILWQKDFNLEGAKEWGDEKVGKFVLTIAKSAGMTKADATLEDAIRFLEKGFPLAADKRLPSLAAGSNIICGISRTTRAWLALRVRSSRNSRAKAMAPIRPAGLSPLTCLPPPSILTALL